MIPPDRIDPVTGCHEWQGARNWAGYGRKRSRDTGRVVSVHREAWEAVNGPIPDGLFVLHHCDNPPCRNVEHLFLGTNTDNMQDAAAKGRLRGMASLNSAKTHCPHGHPYDDENTYVHPNGHRTCRTCRRGWWAASYRRSKQANADLLVTSDPPPESAVA